MSGKTTAGFTGAMSDCVVLVILLGVGLVRFCSVFTPSASCFDGLCFWERLRFCLLVILNSLHEGVAFPLVELRRLSGLLESPFEVLDFCVSHQSSIQDVRCCLWGIAAGHIHCSNFRGFDR